MDFLLDGNTTLGEQNLTLVETEELERLETVKMMEASGPNVDKKNRASFIEVPLGISIPELVLKEIKPSDNIASVIAEQLTHRRNLIFTASIFVAGKKANVAGFR